MSEQATAVVPFRRFYVYALKAGDRVFYVGKGRGTRAMQHLARSHNSRVNEFLDGAEERISIEVLSWHATDEEAQGEEARVIASFDPDALMNFLMPSLRTRSAKCAPDASEKAVSIRLPEGVWNSLAAIAAEERRSTSAQLVKALEKWIDARRENGLSARG